MFVILLIGWCVLLGVVRGSTHSLPELTFDSAKRIIQEDVARYDMSEERRRGYNSCSLSSTERCPITDLPADETTLVYPGGDTRCIFSDSSAFAFQVVPGDKDKLVFYFQGGGACWDELSTKLQFCSTDANPQSLSGIFDRDDQNNKFKDFTIVNVLYCSGDVHGGNTTRPYNDNKGVPVQQQGLANAQSVLDWVAEQQASGALASSFTELMVMGCSAGSIGAQLWGNQVLQRLNWQTAAVMPDSYAGVFPEGSMGPEIYNFGFCSSGFLSDELYQKCINQELTLQEIELEFMADKPAVPYTFIQSKTDIVQISFYIAIGVTGNYSDALINPTEFYEGVNTIFGTYTSARANFVAYLVDGYQHCFTNMGVYYTADAEGPSDNGKTNSKEMLQDWAARMPLKEGDTVETICEGDTQQQKQKQQLRGGVQVDDNTYCSSNVVPNTFEEHYDIN